MDTASYSSCLTYFPEFPKCAFLFPVISSSKNALSSYYVSNMAYSVYLARGGGVTQYLCVSVPIAIVEFKVTTKL